MLKEMKNGKMARNGISKKLKIGKMKQSGKNSGTITIFCWCISLLEERDNSVLLNQIPFVDYQKTFADTKFDKIKKNLYVFQLWNVTTYAILKSTKINMAYLVAFKR